MKKPKQKKSTGPKFIPCGRCIGGLVRIQRGDGSTAMRDCQCLRIFKGLEAPPTPESKSMDANGYWWLQHD